MTYPPTLNYMIRTHVDHPDHSLRMPITQGELDLWHVSTVEEYVEARTNARPEWTYTLEDSE